MNFIFIHRDGKIVEYHSKKIFLRYIYFLNNISFFDRGKFPDFLFKIKKNPILKKTEELLISVKFMKKLGYIDYEIFEEIIVELKKMIFPLKQKDFQIFFETIFLINSIFNYEKINSKIFEDNKIFLKYFIDCFHIFIIRYYYPNLDNIIDENIINPKNNNENNINGKTNNQNILNENKINSNNINENINENIIKENKINVKTNNENIINENKIDPNNNNQKYNNENKINISNIINENNNNENIIIYPKEINEMDKLVKLVKKKKIKILINNNFFYKKNKNKKIHEYKKNILDFKNHYKNNFFDDFDIKMSLYFLVISTNKIYLNPNFKKHKRKMRQQYFNNFIQVFQIKKKNLFFSEDFIYLITLYKILKTEFKIINVDLDLILKEINYIFTLSREFILNEFKSLENNNKFKHVKNIKYFKHNEYNSNLIYLSIFDKNGAFNRYGFLNFIKNERFFKIFMRKSNLKKEIENVLKNLEIKYIINKVDFPFIYDFVIFYNNKEIIINCIDAEKVFLNNYTILLEEEKMKNKYLENINQKYFNISYDLENIGKDYEDLILKKLNNI